MKIEHTLYVCAVLMVGITAYSFEFTAVQCFDLTLVWASSLGAVLATLEDRR